MADLLIRNFDDAILARHSAKPEAQGAPIEAIAQNALRAALSTDRRALLHRIETTRKACAPMPPDWDAADVIRKDRDNR